MADRRCPICQTVAEPEVSDGHEVCSNCGLRLPPADTRESAPPAKPTALEPDPPVRPQPPPPRRDPDEPPPRTRDRDSRDRDRYERPRHREEPSPKVGAFWVAVVVAFAAFVLLAFFYGGVVLIKGKPAPTTRPFNPNMWNNNNQNPWDRPPPPPPWEK